MILAFSLMFWQILLTMNPIFSCLVARSLLFFLLFFLILIKLDFSLHNPFSLFLKAIRFQVTSPHSQNQFIPIAPTYPFYFLHFRYFFTLLLFSSFPTPFISELATISFIIQVFFSCCTLKTETLDLDSCPSFLLSIHFWFPLPVVVIYVKGVIFPHFCFKFIPFPPNPLLICSAKFLHWDVHRLLHLVVYFAGNLVSLPCLIKLIKYYHRQNHFQKLKKDSLPFSSFLLKLTVFSCSLICLCYFRWSKNASSVILNTFHKLLNPASYLSSIDLIFPWICVIFYVKSLYFSSYVSMNERLLSSSASFIPSNAFFFSSLISLWISEKEASCLF